MDSLRSELETTTSKLKEARKAASKHKRELDDLKRRYSTARNTNDMQKHLLASKEKELDALKKSRRSELLNQPIPENPKRGRPVAITPEQRQSVRLLRERGVSVRAIAQAVGVSVGSVQRILNADNPTKA